MGDSALLITSEYKKSGVITNINSERKRCLRLFFYTLLAAVNFNQMVIKHEGQPFHLLKDRKPKNMSIVKLLLKNETVKDAVVIDTGFGLEFRKDSTGFHCFDDDVKGWWYI